MQRGEGLELDAHDLVARCSAELPASTVEAAARRLGLSLGTYIGHFLDESVGALAASRRLLRLNPNMGRIEDVVLALRAELPTGEIMATREAPRSATGPDLKQLLVGAPEPAARITALSLRLLPVPPVTPVGAWFADAGAGLAALARILGAGVHPWDLRLAPAGERVALVLQVPGAGRVGAARTSLTRDLARASGGELAEPVIEAPAAMACEHAVLFGDGPGRDDPPEVWLADSTGYLAAWPKRARRRRPGLVRWERRDGQVVAVVPAELAELSQRLAGGGAQP